MGIQIKHMIKQRTYEENWNANELHYTATITISQKNGSYSR